MNVLLRVLIGAVGLMALAATLLAWFRPESFAGDLGLVTASEIGRATIRSDMGAFFGASSVFAMLGAVHGRSQYTRAALLLLVFAVVGRLVNIGMGGWNHAYTAPLVIQAAVIAIFVIAYRSFRLTEQIG